MNKFKVGDEVKLKKSVKGGQCHNVRGHEEETFNIDFYVNDGVPRYTSTTSGKTCWDCYKDDDFELVNKGDEEVEQYQRKTYRFNKAMPGFKKGELLQEQYDDGTQPYSPLNSNSTVTLQFTDRSDVEDNPEWFTEVFKVTPEYMSREELDQWEAFKKGKTTKPVAPKKQKTSKKASKSYGMTLERLKKVHDSYIMNGLAMTAITYKIKPATVERYVAEYERRYL